MKSLSIIITTLNAVDQLPLLLDTLSKQEGAEFDIIIVDAGSIDGTIELINNNSLPIELIIAPKASIYEGLNIGIRASKTNYYLICGADDELKYDAVKNILKDLTDTNFEMLLYSVEKGGQVFSSKKPTTLRKILGWSSIVASHSVGTIINKQLHEEIGYYLPKYKILADGHFFSKFFNGSRKIFISDKVIGTFALDGTSNKNLFQNIFTTFLIQIESRSFFPQLCLLIFRIIRYRKYAGGC